MRYLCELSWPSYCLLAYPIAQGCAASLSHFAVLQMGQGNTFARTDTIDTHLLQYRCGLQFQLYMPKAGLEFRLQTHRHDDCENGAHHHTGTG